MRRELEDRGEGGLKGAGFLGEEGIISCPGFGEGEEGPEAPVEVAFGKQPRSRKPFRRIPKY